MKKLETLLCGDCLELMKDIPDKSIDMILCDLPYGTTKCEWDTVIPFEPLWKQYKRIVKDNGAILLFSAQPFTTDLINSNRKMFRYEIVWKKTLPTGFLNARRMPMKYHENICVFYKHLPTYNPIMRKVERKDIGRVKTNGGKAQQYNEFRKKDWAYVETGERYPGDVIEFSNWNGALFGNTKNATKFCVEKPVPLLEYFIKTYTNEGGKVLDNCMGTGNTGVACANTGRDFIGMEINKERYEIACKKIERIRLGE